MWNAWTAPPGALPQDYDPWSCEAHCARCRELAQDCHCEDEDDDNEGTMIVKVQTNLNAPAGQRVLVYNKNCTVWYEGDVTPELRKQMRGRPKAFFSARLKGTIVHLDHMVEDRNW